MATRNGSAEWRGDLESGSGELTVGDGVFSGAYSFASRFEEGEGTNPEELIAAAHAACFSMALSGDLAVTAIRSSQSARRRGCTCETSTGPRRSQRIELDTEGRIEGIDQAHFDEHAQGPRRTARCPARSRACRRSS